MGLMSFNSTRNINMVKRMENDSHIFIFSLTQFIGKYMNYGESREINFGTPNKGSHMSYYIYTLSIFIHMYQESEPASLNGLVSFFLIILIRVK